MRVGIMQPYLFPYIGYWQLIYAVDTFVLLDDVNFIMRGYINRNMILIDGEARRFSIPIYHASQNRLICDTKLNFGDTEKNKFLSTIKMAYGKAPYFIDVFPIIESVIMNKTDDLTDYITNSLETIDQYLDIKTCLIKSSQVKKDPLLRAQDRIIAICHTLGADTYINPSGGRSLYSHDLFSENSLNLVFLDPNVEEIEYKQFDFKFVKNLSIIDIMMFNDVDHIKTLLSRFSLNEK